MLLVFARSSVGFNLNSVHKLTMNALFGLSEQTMNLAVRAERDAGRAARRLVVGQVSTKV